MGAVRVRVGGAADEPHGGKESFIRRYIFSQDHKVIGTQYFFAGLFMALVGAALAMLMRLHLGWPDNGVLDPQAYLAAVTMHGTIMVLFFLTPILTGAFGNYLIPLMIGARDMAFPFLNMLSFWTLVPGILALLVSFFVPGGPAGNGWTAYPPLSAVPAAAPGSGLGQTLWILAVAFLCLSSTMGSLNFITTVLNLRTRGMSLDRLPATVWGIFVTAVLALLTFPVLLAAGVMLLLDRVAGTAFFVPRVLIAGQVHGQIGGSPLLWQHLFWFFGHPEVYIIILPALGIVSDLLATFSRTPLSGYRAIVLSLVAIGFVSFLVWGHHMYVTGMHPLLGAAFMASTVSISIPVAVITLNWFATLWQAYGRIRLTAAMLFVIGFLSLFVTGGITGLFLADAPSDIYLHDTYFVVAHFHFVMAASAVFAVFAGTYYWFPKMFGRMMNDTLGKIHFGATFVAIYTTFFPMHFLGIHANSRRLYSTTFYPFLSTVQPLDVFISLSAFVLGAAQLLFIYNFFRSLTHGPAAEANPWRATTLEWTASSPPPHGNWGEQEPIVYRWPYDYSVLGAPDDFLTQTTPTRRDGDVGAGRKSL